MCCAVQPPEASGSEEAQDGQLVQRVAAAVGEGAQAGEILVSVVFPKAQEDKWSNDVRRAFFIVEVTTARRDRFTALFDSHALKAQVGLRVKPCRRSHGS